MKHLYDAVLELGPEVSGNRRLTLFALAFYANELGEGPVDKDHIARWVGVRRRTVNDALNWLEANSYIEISRNGWDLDQGIRRDRYRLTLTAGAR